MTNTNTNSHKEQLSYRFCISKNIFIKFQYLKFFNWYSILRPCSEVQWINHSTSHCNCYTHTSSLVILFMQMLVVLTTW